MLIKTLLFSYHRGKYVLDICFKNITENVYFYQSMYIENVEKNLQQVGSKNKNKTLFKVKGGK